MSKSNVEQVTVQPVTTAELFTMINDLQARIVVLESKVNAPKPESKEMTDDHAKRVLNGDLKEKSHKDAAAALGLTYGQIYSCRLEFTFKNVHKVLKSEGFKNSWVK